MPIRKRPGLIIAAVFLIAAASVYAKVALKRVEVKGYEISRGELTIGVTATSTGTIRAEEEVRMTAQRTGTLSRLFVDEGFTVKKGQAVAELQSEESRQRVAASSASLARAKAQLESMKSNLVSFRSDVDAGIARADAVVREAETRMKRYRDLNDRGYVSKMDFDAIRREYDVARANYDSAVAASGQIKSREDEIKAQQAAVMQAEAEYRLASINYEYSFINSPIAGIITSRPVKIGDTVAPGALVASSVSPDSLYIEAFIDEADVAGISREMPVNVTMDAYQGRTFSGGIYMISPVVLGGKQEARTFEVRVRLHDRGILIKPGMSADIEVVVDRVPNALMVPSKAVMEKDDGRFVYLDRGGRAVLTKIKTGRYNWSYMEVLEGLKEKDVVVVSPDSQPLSDGLRIKTVKASK